MAEQSGPPDIFRAKQKVVKRFTIYNQSDVHIKVIATEREEMKQGRDTKNDANKDAKLEGTAKEHSLSQSNDAQATVVHNLMNAEQHLFIAPQTSEVLTYHGSMIEISIYHQHDGKWINDCENAGCDADYYVFQRNAQNQLEFVLCPDELKQTLHVMMVEKRNEKEMNEWNGCDVVRFIQYLGRKYADKAIDSEIANKVKKAKLNGSRLLTIERGVLERLINDKNAFQIVWNELKRIQKGEIAVPSKEELNYKMISEWNEHMVMMFIATICDGKYYKYKECFDALTGIDLLKMNQEEDITRDIKYDSMIKDPSELNEIWMKIAAIQQNQNVPSERDLMDDYERIEHPTVIIKCFIECEHIAQQPQIANPTDDFKQPHECEGIEVKLPTGANWTKNLMELLYIIPTKLPFLENVEYLMRIDGTIIDFDDPQTFGDLIRIASSTPIIELIQNPDAETHYTITAHSTSDQTFEDALPSDKMEWTNKVYDDLICSIAKSFGVPIESSMTIYEGIGDGSFVLDDIDDIKSAFDDPYNPNKQSLIDEQSLTVFVQIETANNEYPLNKADGTSINMDKLVFQSHQRGTNDIAETLIDLGTNINALGQAKTECFNKIQQILDKSRGDIDDMYGKGHRDCKLALYFQDILRESGKAKSHRYVQCLIKFLSLLCFDIAISSDGISIVIKGTPHNARIDHIDVNFHHLRKAITKPRLSIYQQLDIDIPASQRVARHQSGINDDAFITFELPRIVSENQDQSMVKKIVLNPDHLERFINFLVPNASKYLCKEIYFEKLKGLKLSPIGLFGSKHEILNMLQQYEAISKTLFDALTNDDKYDYLQPGIHAILPVHLHTSDNMKKWDNILYLFY
eukprot:463037_1